MGRDGASLGKTACEVRIVQDIRALLFLLSAPAVNARLRDVHYLGQQVSQLHEQSFVRLIPQLILTTPPPTVTPAVHICLTPASPCF